VLKTFHYALSCTEGSVVRLTAAEFRPFHEKFFQSGREFKSNLAVTVGCGYLWQVMMQNKKQKTLHFGVIVSTNVT
jgi:hypothetical protein